MAIRDSRKYQLFLFKIVQIAAWSFYGNLSTKLFWMLFGHFFGCFFGRFFGTFSGRFLDAHFWTICWRLLLIFSNASVNTIMEAFRRLLGTLFGNVLTYFVFKYVFIKKLFWKFKWIVTQMASILLHSQTLNYKLDLVGGRFLRINQVVDRVEHRTSNARM